MREELGKVVKGTPIRINFSRNISENVVGWLLGVFPCGVIKPLDQVVGGLRVITGSARIVCDDVLNKIESLMIIYVDRRKGLDREGTGREDVVCVRRSRLEQADMKDWVDFECGRKLKDRQQEK